MNSQTLVVLALVKRSNLAVSSVLGIGKKRLRKTALHYTMSCANHVNSALPIG